MTFDWSVVWQHREALAMGTATTILLTVATMLIAVPCGIVVAVARLYAWAPVRALATAYVELFRNLPLILVVFWAFYQGDRVVLHHHRAVAAGDGTCGTSAQRHGL